MTGYIREPKSVPNPMPECTRVSDRRSFKNSQGNSSAICGVLDELNMLLASEAS
jgi:hypothetical protein